SAGGRSITQKIGQTFSTQVLEQRLRKDQILEAYLNLVPFRGELVGIDALSRTLFGKAAHGLDAREAALAAALVRAPNAKATQVAQRACGVLALMQPGTKIDCDGLDLFAAGALQRRDFQASEGVAPHLARRLVAREWMRGQPLPPPSPKGGGRQKMQESQPDQSAPLLLPPPPGRQESQPDQGGNLLLPPPLGEGRGGGSPNRIRSTLRAPLQRFAVQTLQQHLRELRGRHVEDGAIVVLDNTSGEVLAWVGSSGALSAAAEVDGVLALRQPGSTLKPFLYAQALAERRITAASLLEDSSAQIPTAGGLYIPQNYDRQFKGLVSSRTALAASLNVPAVRTLVMVSPEAFHKQLRAVGLPLAESGDYYGYSLALGSAEVSLLSLTNAYRTLANGGRFGEVQFGEPPPQPSPKGGGSQKTGTPGMDSLPRWGRAGVGAAVRSQPALDARAAFIVSDILADPLARARTFGTDSILATRFWTAVKTGTSKDMRDNWALGYSSRYTVGVWVGNASGAPMWDVSGTSGAAPVWAALMNHLHRHEASRAPAPPAGLVHSRTEFGGQLEAARSEWFIRGTEQAFFAVDSGSTGLKHFNNGAAPARITAPASGTILALDPDIPPAHQRLAFSAQGQGLRWRMDGKEFARGNQAQWLPWPGRHVVQLLDASGKVADEIRLEVRGAGVKAGAAARH
ncbi:MAG: transglycosylase domain-containing protein, partial [Rhodoferax sp.]|nr:transglycosylase domain-containing protein [Rhodoferax sp.]